MRKTKLFKKILAVALSVALMGNVMCVQATELPEKDAITENVVETEDVTEDEIGTENTIEEAEDNAQDTEIAADNAEEELRDEIEKNALDSVEKQLISENISTIDYSLPILSYEEFKDSVESGIAMYSDMAVPMSGRKSINEMASGVHSVDEFNLDYELSVDVSNISGERTLPEPNLLIYVNNIDSLKNGVPTTQTELVWLFHDSDADGDRIVDRELDGFPEGYAPQILRESDGTPYGFITHFFNPGTYTVDYYVLDSSQEINGIRYTLDVLTVGDYDVYSGELTSADDVHTYNVPIDFSSTSEAAITLVQPGETDIKITIKDENGEEVKSTYTLEAIARNWCFIDKPEGANGIYNYTVTVAVRNNDYHVNSSGYKIMAGDRKDMEEMLSYVDGAVQLGKYTATDDTYDFRTGYTPSRFESYYKFKADGAATVTAMTKHAETRFKILDASTMLTVYDSENDNGAHRTEYTGSFPYIEKQRLGFQAGTEYYLVIYANNPISSVFVKDNITLTQGMGVLREGREVFEANSSITGGTSGYSPSATISIQSGVPKTAEVKEVDYVSSDGVMLSDIKSFRVKAQYGSAGWQNSVQYKLGIQYPYTPDGNNNTPLIGNWLYGFQTALKTKTMTPKIAIDYMYEWGD